MSWAEDDDELSFGHCFFSGTTRRSSGNKAVVQNASEEATMVATAGSEEGTGIKRIADTQPGPSGGPSGSNPKRKKVDMTKDPLLQWEK